MHGSSASFCGCSPQETRPRARHHFRRRRERHDVRQPAVAPPRRRAILSMMECLYGELRDANADVRAGVGLPPFTRHNGRARRRRVPCRRPQGVWHPGGRRHARRGGRHDRRRDRSGTIFLAHPTVEDDERLAGGRQRPVIEWENELYRRRCAALSSAPRPTPISGPQQPHGMTALGRLVEQLDDGAPQLRDDTCSVIKPSVNLSPPRRMPSRRCSTDGVVLLRQRFPQ